MKTRVREAFTPVRAGEQMKREVLLSIRSKRHPVLRRSFVAVALLLALLSFGGYTYYTPVDLLSIDINPSIELEINRYERVIGWNTFDEEAQSIAAESRLRHRGVEEALTSILASRYLSENEEKPLIQLTLASRSPLREERIFETMLRWGAQSSAEVICKRSSLEHVRAAHRSGLSLGKYHSYLLLSEEEELTLEEVREMTMREIHERMQHRGRGPGAAPQERGPHHQNRP